MEIITDNILTTDFSDGDILYISSLCFPEPLLEQISDLCEKCKPGTRIMGLKEMSRRPFLKLTAVITVRMTWDWQDVYVYLKI
jgi:hypothetical protein